MPTGVQGSAPGTLSTSRPRLTGCRPSASLAGSIASRTAYSSTWSGSGSWTMYPVHAGSALSSATTARTSACVAVAGSSRWMLAMPTWAQSLCLASTYQRLPGSSPTNSVPSPGRWPAAVTAATRSVSSVRIAAAVALPSRMVAGTPDSVPDGAEPSGKALAALRSQSGGVHGHRDQPLGTTACRPPEERHERARPDPLPLREPVRAGGPEPSTGRRRVARADHPGAQNGDGRGVRGGLRCAGLRRTGGELLHDPAVLDDAGEDPPRRPP